MTGVQSTRVYGIDATLDTAPGLTEPPLSLLDLALTLYDTNALIDQQEQNLERLASAQAAVDKATADLEGLADTADHVAVLEAQQRVERAHSEIADIELWGSAAMKQLAAQQDWEGGFEYLPELGNAEAVQTINPAVNAPASGATGKSTTTTNSNRYWYDPFQVIAHDKRSLFGWPNEDGDSRIARAQRALIGHEAWQAEREFWSGSLIPTNYHLTASPSTPTTIAQRSIPAWPNPDAAKTTVLGTAVGLAQSLAALDQSIASADAGTGMIHATPYVVQRWMQQYPYIRDSAGRVYTVNMNLIVPGFGYPGTGPDQNRSVADGVLNSTTTVTSATAAFTALDVGQGIAGAGIPAGAYIVTVTNGTTVVISAAATATGSGVTLTIGPGGDLTNSTTQWAYATDRVYHGRGEVVTVPWSLRQLGSAVYVDDQADFRAEVTEALLTNRLLRAAVLINTTTA